MGRLKALTESGICFAPNSQALFSARLRIALTEIRTQTLLVVAVGDDDDGGAGIHCRPYSKTW